MEQKQFERIFRNFIEKGESKNVSFDSLTKEEKINFFISEMDEDFSQVLISTTKEMEIEKLSKDLRFSLISEATKSQDMELISKLSEGKGVAKVTIKTTFERASQTSQLDYLAKHYSQKFGGLPESVSIPILGGENFKSFIEYAYNKLNVSI